MAQAGTNGFGNLCTGTVNPYSGVTGAVYSTGAGTSKYSTTCKIPGTNPAQTCHRYHGTAVASFAAGDQFEKSDGTRGSGIAPQAKLILIKAGATDSSGQQGFAPKAISAAIDYVSKTLVPKYGSKIASVNISIDGNKLDDGQTCEDFAGINAAATEAKSKGVAVVMSSGNGNSQSTNPDFMVGYRNATGSMSCGEDVINVGATGVTSLNGLTE